PVSCLSTPSHNSNIFPLRPDARANRGRRSRAKAAEKRGRGTGRGRKHVGGAENPDSKEKHVAGAAKPDARAKRRFGKREIMTLEHVMKAEKTDVNANA
ncbi:hypothetical protein KI387_006794, partial [Taxus chinensis]